ncbi:MAG: polyprenyl synthetase family protein [Planctomycetota bacterium]
MRGVLDIPDSLAPVQEALALGLARVEERFDRQLESDIPPVSALCKHIERYRGKMLRPTLVLLIGLAAHPDTSKAATEGPEALAKLWTDEHVGLAAVVEMVHMATLVHDDVLDEAEVRRRGTTVNRLTDNETAVILGDYLIASAYHLCSTVESREASLAVGDTAMVMCAGELLQLHHRGDWSLDEPTYFEIVKRKTAALIGLAAALGAASSGAGDESESAARSFGETIGIAFQIQDDLLDLTGEEATVGKSVRRDLAKGKLTLPLVHALAAAEPSDRGRLLRLIESAEGEPSAEDEAELLGLLRRLGSVESAVATARRLVADALPGLERFPETPAREMLRLAAESVVARTF